MNTHIATGRLVGKVAIVTGIGSGHYCALMFARQGA